MGSWYPCPISQNTIGIVIKYDTSRVNKTILPIGILFICNSFVVETKNIIEYGFS